MGFTGFFVEHLKHGGWVPGTLRSCRCRGKAGQAHSSGPKRHAGVCLLGPARSPFRIGDFDVLPSLKKTTARTKERAEVATRCQRPP